MAGLIRFVFIIVSIVGGALFFVQQVMELASGSKGLNRRLVEILRSTLNGFAELVPIEKEELKLLSFNKEVKRTRKKGKRVYRGVYKTIYDEALFSFAKTRINRQRTITVVQTSDNEYIIDEYPGMSAIYLNGIKIGEMIDHHKLVVNERELGQLLYRSRNAKEVDVLVGSKKILTMLYPNSEQSATDRVFQFLDNDIEELDSTALGLVFYQLMKME